MIINTSQFKKEKEEMSFTHTHTQNRF